MTRPSGRCASFCAAPIPTPSTPSTTRWPYAATAAVTDSSACAADAIATVAPTAASTTTIPRATRRWPLDLDRARQRRVGGLRRRRLFERLARWQARGAAPVVIAIEQRARQRVGPALVADVGEVDVVLVRDLRLGGGPARHLVGPAH